MRQLSIFLALPILVLILGGCEKKFEEYPENPNVAGENSSVPPSVLLNRVLFEIHQGGGVVDGQSGSVPEVPLFYLSRLNQFTTGLTFPLYGGSNRYNWTSSATTYNNIKNITEMEKFARNQGEENNAFLAVAKFLKAYSYVWMTERMGDIPLIESGQGLGNLTPAFDSQEEVYAQCLDWLDEANEDLASIMNATEKVNLDGDIYMDNDLLRWQKTVNAYKLRVLISLSKRADDTPDLRIKERFAEVVNNPGQFPVYQANEEHMEFAFVVPQNRYPSSSTLWYERFPRETTVASTILNITTETEDPRTYLIATPAPAELEAGKEISDFTAYKGTENGRPQTDLNNEAQDGEYSYPNYERYAADRNAVPENYIIIGYPEMCFNIAEGINRGWAGGSAEEWYLKGINASLAFYQIADGTEMPISQPSGGLHGTVNADVDNFLNHPEVVYKGGQDGLEQILKQKYVSMWQNSGWEPYYNFRRTGIPAFSEGPGNNSQGQIPLRWRYPIREVENNPQNANEAISSQFGSDDVFAEMWLIKD